MKNNRALTRLILTTALGASLLFAAGPALADHDWSADCHRRLETDRARIDHDADRFGKDSRAVHRDVDRMESDRHWCRDHKADWDHDRFDTGIYLHL